MVEIMANRAGALFEGYMEYIDLLRKMYTA